MAIPVVDINDLRDPIKRDKILDRLTAPQIQNLINQLKPLARGRGGAKIADSPAVFAHGLSKGRWVIAPHLERLSDSLVRTLNKSTHQRLLVSMPPRHGKSELISYWFPLWLLAKNPRARIILVSYEADFAMTWGRRVRNAVSQYGDELNLMLDDSSTAAHRWSLTAGGEMRTAGAGGPITGKGADILIIDDPIKNEEEASSEIMREALWNWWQTTAFTRLEPGASCVMVATRWHQDDLLGRLEKHSNTGEGIAWEVLKLPAIAESHDPIGRLIGEPLWPDRYDAVTLATIRKGMSPYNWSALYQQSPTPEEGGAVKRAWWKYYKIAPAKFDQVIQSWDLAFKDTVGGSYTVGQVWGRKGAEFWLIDQIRGHMNAPEVLLAMSSMAARYPEATAKIIEERASGPAVIQMLQKKVYGIIPWPPKGQRMESKEARLQATIPLIEAGNVYLPEGEKAPWIWDYIEELAAFPKGSNDDQVDATSQALSFLMRGSFGAIDLAHREALRKPPPETTEEFHAKQMSNRFKKAVKESARTINERDGVFQKTRPRLW